MKNKLYFSDIISLEKEFQSLVGGRIQNIYDLGNEHCYLIKINIQLPVRTTKYLISKPGAYLYQITNPPQDRRLLPSSFCQKMRRHFKNKRISEISHYGNDRILRLYIGERETQSETSLVIELFGEGNISICDAEGKLLSFIYPHKYDGKRLKIATHHPGWDLQRRGEWSSEIITNKIDKLSFDNMTSVKSIGHEILKIFGKDISEEVSYHLKQQDEFTPDLIKETLTSVIDKLLTSKQGFIINGNTCVPYHYQYLVAKKIPVTSYSSFSEALSVYLQAMVPKQVSQSKTIEKKNTSLDTIARKKYNIQMSNKKMLDDLHRKITKIEADIMLIQDHQLQVEVFLKNSQQNLSKTQGKDHLVEIPLDNRQVSLCADKSYYDNLTFLYTKLKKLKARSEKVSEGLDKALKNLNQSTISSKSKATKNIEKIKLTTNKWYHEYYWFFTKNNFLVVCGKNSSQNETLVKKMMEKHDIYLHSEVRGSGSAILKNPEACQIEIIDYEQAGAFVICHSNAWKAVVSDRAYWVTPDQVSKTTNTGEYVTKGSFIVRGTRHYLSIPDLVLGIVLHDNELMVAPYACLNHYQKRIKIIPGRQRRNLILNRLLSYFNISGSDKSILDEQIPHFIRCV